ncbi:GumC family protein [Flavicella sediminum]|uniref:GumC family protein n=1 Tax=Flavicella sediminum TaxID=2585141 RepID=UPI001123E6D4|nr:polysaccharide biosynthesis tyrosine autokinase [Flavicella sediminum]
MSQNSPNYNIQNKVEENFSIRDEIEKYLIHWKWFFFCIVASLLIAFIYIRYSSPLYQIDSSILIKDNQSSITSELSAFQDLGLLEGSGSNIQNEMQILKSRSLALSVVEDLDLNIRYYEEGRIKESEIHKGDCPILFKEIPSLITKEIDTTFYVRIINLKEFELISASKKESLNLKFGSEFKLEKNGYTIELNKKYKDVFLNKQVRVKVSSIHAEVDNIVSGIQINPVDKFFSSSVLLLSMKSPVLQKGIDIIDKLVDNYNSETIRDKSEVNLNTSIFISKRLVLIKDDLERIDKEIESYKRINNITDISSETTNIYRTLDIDEREVFEISTQLSLIELMDSYFEQSNTDYQLIPTNLGFKDESLLLQVEQFNEIVLKRNKLLRNSRRNNPLVLEFNGQLSNYQKSLRESFTNLKRSLQTTLTNLKEKSAVNNSRISEIPGKEREFKNILRQQTIKEELYLYLLQKQEEIEISLAVTTSNSKIIDHAHGSLKPISPKKNIVVLSALLLGLIIPFGVIYLNDMLDTKLHTRKDLEENVSAPILGDIPINDTGENIVVKEGGRSSTAEAFRLLRTNLDFLLTGVEENCKSLFITSTTSGEGKSFVSVNLACTLALSGKKVALVGMDLRAPKITEYLGLPNTKGITNYIKDENINVFDLKFNIPGYDNLDIYSSGIIPPNPAELLLNQRVEDLFAKLKEKYDYIVVDTAPVNLVTDTLLVSKYADLFIYVSRAGFLDKRLLAIPQNLYTDKRLPNMAMLINASDYKKSYGYGAYGAYGYGEVEKLPWWKTIFKA